MCNVKFFALLLGLVCSRNAATIKEEASKNTVWGMAAYDLRGMEDGNFSRFKCRIAMKNEAISLSQTAFPKG